MKPLDLDQLERDLLRLTDLLRKRGAAHATIAKAVAAIQAIDWVKKRG